MNSKREYYALMGILPSGFEKLENCIDGEKRIKLFKNEELTCENSEKEHIIYIKSGVLKLCCLKPGGTDLDLAYFPEGSIIEQRKLLNRPDSFKKLKISACENSIVFLIPFQKLEELIKEDEEIKENYDDYNLIFLNMLTERTLMTSCLEAHERFLGWILRLSATVPKMEDGSCFIPCNMTHQQISDFLFIHVTSFHRVFSALKKENLVKKEHGGFYIKSIERIESYPSYCDDMKN